MVNKTNFKEQRLYDAIAVDNEIAVLESSLKFYKNKCKELEKEVRKCI